MHENCIFVLPVNITLEENALCENIISIFVLYRSLV